MSLAHLALPIALAVAIQPAGSFHGDEAVARNGEHWLALRVDAKGARLDRTTVRVRRVEDAVIDAPGQKTGKDITVEGAEPLMLLRGDGLRAGAVARVALSSGQATPVKDGPMDMPFHGTTYRLALACPAGSHGPDVPMACHVVLSRNGTTQRLFAIDGTRGADGALMLGDDAVPKLLFAGDLDHDGRLDLILDTTGHYNVSRPTLFLSSGAKAGALVRQVAVNESSGC